MSIATSPASYALLAGLLFRPVRLADDELAGVWPPFAKKLIRFESAVTISNKDALGRAPRTLPSAVRREIASSQ